MIKRTTRVLTKPYGYKSVKNVTAEEKESLKQALWSSYALEDHYDYAQSPIIDFYGLGKMDNLFAWQFREGKDISFIVSVADWTQHTFRSTRNLDNIVKKHETYHSRNKEGFFNLDNAVIIFENFFQYLKLPENESSSNKEGGDKYEEDIKHAYLSDFCKISIHLYCHHRKLNNTEEKKICFKWFKRFFDESKDFYSNKGQDNYYWSRHALNMFSEVLKVSKNISLQDEIVATVLPDIEMYMPKLWKEMDYVVKDRLFKPIVLGTDSFKIVEDLLLRLVSEDDILSSIKKEMKSDKMESREKVVYFLTKYWHKLTPEECDSIPDIFFKNIKVYDNTLHTLEQLMHVITPLDKTIKIFDSRLFTDEVKATEIYKKCYEILDARTLHSQLQKKLTVKPGKEKMQKI